MSESPLSAVGRAAGVVIDAIRGTTDAPTVPYGEGTTANGGCVDCWKTPGRHCCLWHEDDNLRTAGDLVVGNLVRLAGSWAKVANLEADGSLWLQDGISSFAYTPTSGELFVWQQGTAQ